MTHRLMTEEKPDLLPLCQDLRMAWSGSADPISDEETDAAIGYLKQRLADWRPAIEWAARYDECVRLLVLATIGEVEWHREWRRKAAIANQSKRTA